MQEVYILSLKKPGLRHLSRLSKSRKEEIILNEVRIGGSPLIKATLSVSWWHISAYNPLLRRGQPSIVRRQENRQVICDPAFLVKTLGVDGQNIRAY